MEQAGGAGRQDCHEVLPGHLRRMPKLSAVCLLGRGRAGSAAQLRLVLLLQARIQLWSGLGEMSLGGLSVLGVFGGEPGGLDASGIFGKNKDPQPRQSDIPARPSSLDALHQFMCCTPTAISRTPSSTYSTEQFSADFPHLAPSRAGQRKVLAERLAG